LDRANEEAEFPQLPFRDHLADWLLEVGPVMKTGMGPVALSHLELRAWADNVGLTFEGNEAEWLQKMSDVYASEIAKSDGKDTPQPFRE